MADRPRIFLSCSFAECNRNISDAFKEVAETESFDVVTGEPPGATTPQALVRSRILSSDCFAALMTSDRSGMATAWVYNEIGMAFMLGLPLLICKEQNVEDPGLVQYEVSYATFVGTNLRDFKLQLQYYLRAVRKDPRRIERTTLGNFISGLARDAISGHGLSGDHDALANTSLARKLERILSETRMRRFSFGESEEFSEKQIEHLEQKEAIAKYVFAEILKPFAGQVHDWIFMDSGTVTYTIGEEIVKQGERIPIMTNNLASCRLLSSIPAYPSFIIPGELESRYVATLGDECVEFLRKKLTASDGGKRIELGLVAATSLTSTQGLCGNDPRHNAVKRALLELCPRSVVTFEGEKLLKPSGVPIFDSEDNWSAFASSCRRESRSVQFVTHYPDQFESMPLHRKRFFESEIGRLRSLFGPESVVVLGDQALSP
jgi:DeoR/GlpR family transcriptional regulator of sugar metabolism